MSSEAQDTFFLSPVEQDSIIGWMLQDHQFMVKCKAALKPRYFTHAVPAELFTIIAEFADKYQKSPTMAELEGAIHAKFVSATDYNQRRDRAIACAAATRQIALKVLSDKMTDWYKLSIMRTGMQEAVAIFNKKQLNKSKETVSKFMKELTEADFNQEERVSYADPLAFYKQRAISQMECCTVGHPDFDEVLKPKSRTSPNAPLNIKDPFVKPPTNGGLLPGDMTVLVGPSNAGKTTSVVSIIAQNILLRKFVLLVTHEQKDEDIKNKIYQAMTRSKTEELDPYNLERDQDRLRRLNTAANLLENYLVHVHWIKPGKMFVEDVTDIIILRQEKMAAQEIKFGNVVLKEFGKGFDLLVNDYPGILKSRALNSKNLSSHEEKGYIYRQFMELGRSYKFHVLVPAQTNRQGYKSSNEDSDHVLGQGDIADSFAISQATDNLITINRGPDDKTKSQVRYYVDKSRSGPTGITFVSRTDFHTSRSMGPDLACTVFHAGANATQKDIDIRLGAYDRATQEGKDPRAVVNEEIEKLKNSMPDSKEQVKAANILPLLDNPVI